MSDDKAQGEPSMEDILASIRRILSEEEAQGGPAEPEAEMSVAEPEPEMAVPVPTEAPAPRPTIVPPPMAAPMPEPEPFDDILELTEDMIAEAMSPPPPPPPPPRRPAPTPAPAPDYSEDDEEEFESIMAQPARAAGTSSLAELARAVAHERAIGLGNGGITLEDLVREILRTLIKGWLDENLPYMIERMVRQEIERMAKRAEKL